MILMEPKEGMIRFAIWCILQIIGKCSLHYSQFILTELDFHLLLLSYETYFMIIFELNAQESQFCFGKRNIPLAKNVY
jgi:hypothetical protein